MKGPATSMTDLLRHISILGLASLISGVLVGGVGGRVVMAISAAAAQPEAIGRITENGNRIGEFTLGGTLGLIVFVGLLGGMAASITVVASEPFVQRAGFLGGPIIGAAVLATVGSGTFDSFDFRILEPASLNVAMFLGLLVMFGVMIVVAARLIDRWMPTASPRSMPVYLTIVALGSLPLLTNILFFTSRDFCGCEPWTVMGLLLLVTVGAAVGWHLLSMMDCPKWQRMLVEMVGSATLLAILILGLTRVLEDIGRIL